MCWTILPPSTSMTVSTAGYCTVLTAFAHFMLQIFIGPCESRQGISTSCLISFASVFVRNTKNSRFVIACQQLRSGNEAHGYSSAQSARCRTRDCTGLDMLLYCSAGQPVVESSSGIRLGCFAFNYFSLRSALHPMRYDACDFGCHFDCMQVNLRLPS